MTDLYGRVFPGTPNQRFWSKVDSSFGDYFYVKNVRDQSIYSGDVDDLINCNEIGPEHFGLKLELLYLMN